MEDTIRKLASIQIIVALDPIPNADRIEVATVLGWHVVVKKGEFQVGDQCVYFEVDSILPRASWSEFLVDENRPDKPIRLKTIRLRGQVSQGLAVPLSILWEYSAKAKGYWEGEDVTELIGVIKYEPAISAQLAGICRRTFPGFLVKTDSHRVQAHPRVIDEIQGRDCYITLKVDGTSSTFYNRVEDRGSVDPPIQGDDFGVCSRNMDLKPSDTNTYWKMAAQYDLAKKLAGTNLALQGETFGPGIQGNRLGTDKVGTEFFDVFDIKEHRYYNLNEMILFFEMNGLEMVRMVYQGSFIWKTVDELVEFASKQNYPNHTNKHDSPAEGIVIRPMVEAISETLQGRMAFKVISPRFLLKYE